MPALDKESSGRRRACEPPLLRDARGGDVRSSRSDLVGVEPALPARVLPHGFRVADALGLPLADEGALEFCDHAEQVQHHLSERVVAAGSVGLLFLDELDGGALRDDLVDDVAKISKRARKSVHLGDADEVAVSDVADAFRQVGPVGAGSARDILFEDPVDGADRLDLPIEVLVGRADSDVAVVLRSLRHS